VVVSDLDRALRYLGSDGQRREDRVVVKPAPGLGAVMAVRSADNG
jgi:hypothetical protein